MSWKGYNSMKQANMIFSAISKSLTAGLYFLPPGTTMNCVM